MNDGVTHKTARRCGVPRLPRERRTFSLTRPALDVLETYAAAADMNLSQWLSRALVRWPSVATAAPGAGAGAGTSGQGSAPSPARAVTGGMDAAPGSEYVEVVVEAADVGKTAWMLARDAGVAG